MVATLKDFVYFLLVILGGIVLFSLFINPINEVIPSITEVLPFLENKSLFEFFYENTNMLVLLIASGAVSFVLYRWYTS
ncbi:hypothetical protein LCGC14_1068300 [marine sediment metagenome]|uniref:Uncharacterized protein n=1 Tax=marine sediment metagenome TaxID=412755 RepID=A0A0F9QPW8_9ZZZZ|nr:hypothetical protein [archaeon]